MTQVRRYWAPQLRARCGRWEGQRTFIWHSLRVVKSSGSQAVISLLCHCLSPQRTSTAHDSQQETSKNHPVTNLSPSQSPHCVSQETSLTLWAQPHSSITDISNIQTCHHIHSLGPQSPSSLHKNSPGGS